jgi:nucleolar complex protein 3
LDIDLSEFIAMLYANLMTVTLASGEIESIKSDNPGNANVTDLLFRALDLVFTPRASASVSAGAVTVSPWRAAAFAKRLLSACIHWPTTSPILRSLELVKSMVARDSKVEAMLSTEDRISNGVYRPDVDDPQLCQPFETAFWELHLLRKQHWDPRVREEAEKLLNYSSQ